MIKSVAIGVGVGLLAAFLFSWNKPVSMILGGAVGYGIQKYEIPKINVPTF